MEATLPEIVCKSDATRAAYEELLGVLAGLSGVVVEEKKTSLHMVAGRAAFLGVHPRKNGLRLNIVLSRALEGERIAKSEQVSRSRFHNEVDVAPSDFDAELRGWISEAYELQTA